MSWILFNSKTTPPCCGWTMSLIARSSTQGLRKSSTINLKMSESRTQRPLIVYSKAMTLSNRTVVRRKPIASATGTLCLTSNLLPISVTTRTTGRSKTSSGHSELREWTALDLTIWAPNRPLVRTSSAPLSFQPGLLALKQVVCPKRSRVSELKLSLRSWSLKWRNSLSKSPKKKTMSLIRFSMNCLTSLRLNKPKCTTHIGRKLAIRWMTGRTLWKLAGTRTSIREGPAPPIGVCQGATKGIARVRKVSKSLTHEACLLHQLLTYQQLSKHYWKTYISIALHNSKQ